MMMFTKSEFDNIAMLLPFYINGTLGAQECARIDAALAQSEELRNELTALGQLAQTIKTGGHGMTEGTDNSETRLDTVLARIEDKPKPAPTPGAPHGAKPQAIGALLGFLNPKRWHPAVSLALVAVAAAQGAAISNFNTGKQESAAQIAGLQKKVGDLEFELASGPGGTQAGTIIIEVKGSAVWSDVEILLGKEGLSIVGGPSDGAITLSSAAKGAALAAQIERLRASPLIASADKAA